MFDWYEAIEADPEFLLQEDDGYVQCECTDSLCPQCAGRCSDKALSLYFEEDTDDAEGVAMCEGCGDDALATGLYVMGDLL